MRTIRLSTGALESSQSQEAKLAAQAISMISGINLLDDAGQQLVEESGSYEESLFLGAPVDVPTLVWQMRKSVETDDPGGIDDRWRRFEPLTGVDCSSFYTPTGVDLKAVTAVLDEFEAQRPSASHRFEPGKRYFFGHPVPR